MIVRATDTQTFLAENNINTVLDILSERAATKGEEEAYVFLKDTEGLCVEQRISFAELEIHARKLAAYLLTFVSPGDRVIMCYQPGLAFVQAFYACLYAGIVAVPLSLPQKARQPRKIFKVIETCGAKLVLTSAKLVVRCSLRWRSCI